MFEWILFGIGFVGFALAGYWDLKTTEFPDWLPYSMIILALVIRSVYSFTIGDFTPILNSVIIGLVFLGFGLALYFTKQWGDGDAWLLGALGFLFPDPAGFAFTSFFAFPVALFFNFFFIAFFYLLVYSIALGVKSRDASREFFSELRGDLKGIAAIIFVFSFLCLGMFLYFHYFYLVPLYVLNYILILPPLFIALVFFLRYGRFVEKNLFKRKVPVSKLREGDVLVSQRWRGLTEKEVKNLQDKGGEVWIKEGVRFAPVFVVTLIVTLFYGSLIGLFI
ncbi:MAG: prepilin peptidase [Candidatus Aenigmatarchaeota archaeon]|nr:MAG: prepilin peptidase [Candidatus Aenigmarchaeota archaeon]